MTSASPSHLGTVVLLTGLPSRATEADIRSLLCTYGLVTQVKLGCIRGQPNGTAQVRFRSPVPELCPDTSLRLMDCRIRARPLPRPILPPSAVPTSASHTSTDGSAPAPAASSPTPQASSSLPTLSDPTGQAKPLLKVPAFIVSGGANALSPSTTSPTCTETARSPTETTSATTRGESSNALFEKLPPLPASFCDSSSDDEG